MHITGIVESARRRQRFRRNAAASRQHDLPHEVLDAPKRCAAFRPSNPADYVAVFQPDGGYLAAEPAIAAMIASAQGAGAELQTGVKCFRLRRTAARAHRHKPGRVRGRQRHRHLRPLAETLVPHFPAGARHAPGARLVRAAAPTAALAICRCSSWRAFTASITASRLCQAG